MTHNRPKTAPNARRRYSAATQHKLTDSDVRAIRATRDKVEATAAAFGCSPQMVSAIRCRRRYATLPDAEPRVPDVVEAVARELCRGDGVSPDHLVTVGVADRRVTLPLWRVKYPLAAMRALQIACERAETIVTREIKGAAGRRLAKSIRAYMREAPL